MDDSRVKAFEDALLNTVVRGVREAFSGLTLSNCMDSLEFRAAALVALRSKLLAQPVEPAMFVARNNLLSRLENHRP